MLILCHGMILDLLVDNQTRIPYDSGEYRTSSLNTSSELMASVVTILIIVIVMHALLVLFEPLKTKP